MHLQNSGGNQKGWWYPAKNQPESDDLAFQQALHRVTRPLYVVNHNGRTAIAQDVEDGQIVGGVPAIPMTQAKKNALVATDLYGLFQRVRRIEKRLAKADSAS